MMSFNWLIRSIYPVQLHVMIIYGDAMSTASVRAESTDKLAIDQKNRQFPFNKNKVQIPAVTLSIG